MSLMQVLSSDIGKCPEPKLDGLPLWCKFRLLVLSAVMVL